MEVCDVCGAFLIVGDAQQRIDDHLMGKQHVGYARLKSALQEIMVKIDFCLLKIDIFFNIKLVTLKLKMKLKSFRTNAKKRVTKRNKEGRRNGNKERERMKSLTGGGEMATEIEIATEIGTNVEAGEWTTIKIVTTLAVIGEYLFVLNYFLLSYFKHLTILKQVI